MDIWERVLGFMDAQAVLTAHDRGVFEVLGDGPASAAAVAVDVQLPACTCQRLLALLAAIGLLERLPDGRYMNTPDAQSSLVRRSTGYVGGLFPYVREVLYPAWGRLDAALARNAAHCDADGTNVHEAMFADPGRLRSFLAGMHAITYRSARVLAGVAPEMRALDSVVDVGGASGAFLIALAEAGALRRGIVFDLPPVVAIAEEYIAAAGLANRIGTHAGDFWADPLPAGAAAYALGFILHDWDDAGGDVILDKIAAAAETDSTLIIGECLLEEDGTAPLFAVRQDVNMLVSARGRERTRGQYDAWLRRHGFAIRRAYAGPYGKHYMLATRANRRFSS
jgi:hypothetical protein